MGTYNVWVLTPGDTVVFELCDAIEPYNEKNHIPENWPGLSFDYYETLGQRTAADSYLALRNEGIGSAPYVLICPSGQVVIHDQSRHYGGAPEGVIVPDTPPVLEGGFEEMLNQLADRPDWTVHQMHWHA